MWVMSVGLALLVAGGLVYLGALVFLPLNLLYAVYRESSQSNLDNMIKRSTIGLTVLIVSGVVAIIGFCIVVVDILI